MDAAATPAQRFVGMFVTLTGLASLVAFGLATWIAGLELANSHQAPATRWSGLAMGVIFAAAFAVGPIMAWVEYKRLHGRLALAYAVAPYAALTLCWIGLKAMAH